MASSDSLSPTTVTGGACSQSSECRKDVAKSQALSTSGCALERIEFLWFVATGASQASGYAVFVVTAD